MRFDPRERPEFDPDWDAPDWDGAPAWIRDPGPVPEPDPDVDEIAARDALERITAYQRRRPGCAHVRRIAAAWCPTGPKLVAGVYVVDAEVWLWLAGTRRAPSRSNLNIKIRETEGPRAVWLRPVDEPHAPGCHCQPVGDQWATCRCCRADRLVTYSCDDKVTARPFPRTGHAR